MKKYEAIFILDDQKVDDNGNAFAKKAEATIAELGGSVAEVVNMGQRQMAYMLRKRSTGLYWSIVCELPESQVVVFKERYRLDEAVLHLEVFIFDRPEKFTLNNRVPDERE